MVGVSGGMDRALQGMVGALRNMVRALQSMVRAFGEAVGVSSCLFMPCSFLGGSCSVFKALPSSSPALGLWSHWSPHLECLLNRFLLSLSSSPPPSLALWKKRMKFSQGALVERMIQASGPWWGETPCLSLPSPRGWTSPVYCRDRPQGLSRLLSGEEGQMQGCSTKDQLLNPCLVMCRPGVYRKQPSLARASRWPDSTGS